MIRIPSMNQSARSCFLAVVLLGWALAAGPARARQQCRPIAGVDQLVRAEQVVLLGELHGTTEAPAFVAALACHALDLGLKVTVALELPQADQGAIDQFMAAPKDEGAARVLGLPFWKRAEQDGRTSVAMLDLLRTLQAMKRSGDPVQVVLLDRPSDFRRRDEAMAKRLLEVAKASSDDLVIALVGNLHARTVSGSGRMGELVLQGLGASRVNALDLSHEGGTAWICEAAQGCGPLALRGRSEGGDWRVTLRSEANVQGYYGTFHVGRISASPPAIGSTE